MERRVLLAIFLSFLVLYVYQALVVKPVPKPVIENGPETAVRTAAPVPPPAAAPKPAPATAADAAALAKPGAGQPLVAESGEREVRVETTDVIAVFTNRGGRLKSWRLKRYLDQQRQPQELIETRMLSQPLPFTLRTADDPTTNLLNGSLYTVSGEPAGGQTQSPIDLRFEYRDASGLHAVKEFHLEPTSYIFRFKATVSQGDRAVTPTIVWGPAVGDVATVSQYSQKAEALLFQNGKVERHAPKDLAK